MTRLPLSFLSRHHLAWGVALLVLVLLPFVGALVQSYGYYDDYSLKARVVGGGWSFCGNEAFHDGRPLSGWLVGLLFGGAPEVGSLWLPRAFGLVAIALFAFTLFAHGRRLGWSCGLALSWALVGTLQPGWAVFGFWATVAPIGWSFLLGYWAGLSLDLAHRRLWLGVAGTLICGLAALLIYQMGVGMLVVAYLLPRFAQGTSENRRRWLETLLPGGVLAAFFGLYLFGFKALVHAGVFSAERAERGSLLSELDASLQHLGTFLLPAALQGWTRIFGPPVAWMLTAPLILALIGGLVLLVRRRGRDAAWLILSWLGALALLAAPLIAPAALWAHYRVLPAISLGLLLPLLVWIPTLEERWRRSATVAFGIVGGLCWAATSYAVSFQRVPELAREWRTFRSTVAEQMPEPRPYVAAVNAGVTFPESTAWQLPGEYRYRSIQPDWVVQHMLMLAWAELAGAKSIDLAAGKDVRVEISGVSRAPAWGYLAPPVLDFTEGEPLPAGLTEPPDSLDASLEGFGAAAALPAGRHLIPELGILQDIGGGWLHLSHLGWVLRTATDDAGVSLWSPRLGSLHWDKDERRLHRPSEAETLPQDSDGVYEPFDLVQP